ncbi:hypothetical protein ACLOJK_004100 [Asimina triloba]
MSGDSSSEDNDDEDIALITQRFFKKKRSFTKKKALVTWAAIEEALAEDAKTIEEESEHEAQLGICDNNI